MYSLNIYNIFTNIYVHLIIYLHMYVYIYMYMYIFKFPLNLLVELMCKEEARYFTLWFIPFFTKSPGPLAREGRE